MRRLRLERVLLSCSARHSLPKHSLTKHSLPKHSLPKRAPLAPLESLRRIAPAAQAWDAGYCDAKWPFPMARLPGGFYVNHYKVRAGCRGND